MANLPGLARSRRDDPNAPVSVVSINDSLSSLASQEGGAQARAKLLTGDAISQFGESVTELTIRNAETSKANDIQQGLNESMNAISNAQELEDLATIHEDANKLLESSLQDYPFNSAGLRQRFLPQMGNLNAQAVSRRNTLAERDMRSNLAQTLETAIRSNDIGAIDADADNVAQYAGLVGEAATAALIGARARAIAEGQMSRLIIEDQDYARKMTEVLSDNRAAMEDERAEYLNETQRAGMLSFALQMRDFHNKQDMIHREGDLTQQLRHMVENGGTSQADTPLLFGLHGQKAGVNQLYEILDHYGPPEQTAAFGLVPEGGDGTLSYEEWSRLRLQVKEASDAQKWEIEQRGNLYDWAISHPGSFQPNWLDPRLKPIVHDFWKRLIQLDEVFDPDGTRASDYQGIYNTISKWANRVPLSDEYRDLYTVMMQGNDTKQLAKSAIALYAARQENTWNQRGKSDLPPQVLSDVVEIAEKANLTDGSESGDVGPEATANNIISRRQSPGLAQQRERRFEKNIDAIGGTEGIIQKVNEEYQRGFFARMRDSYQRVTGTDTDLYGPIRAPDQVGLSKEEALEISKFGVLRDLRQNVFEEVGQFFGWFGLPLGQGAEDAGQYYRQTQQLRDRQRDNLRRERHEDGFLVFGGYQEIDDVFAGLTIDPEAGLSTQEPPQPGLRRNYPIEAPVAMADDLLKLYRWNSENQDLEDPEMIWKVTLQQHRQVWGKSWMHTADATEVIAENPPEMEWIKSGGSSGPMGAIQMRRDIANHLEKLTGYPIDPSWVYLAPEFYDFDSSGRRRYTVVMGLPSQSGKIQYRTVQDAEERLMLYTPDFTASDDYKIQAALGASGIAYKLQEQYERLQVREHLATGFAAPLFSPETPPSEIPEPISSANNISASIEASQRLIRTHLASPVDPPELRWGREVGAKIRHLLSDEATYEELEAFLNSVGIQASPSQLLEMQLLALSGRPRMQNVQPGTINPQE